MQKPLICLVLSTIVLVVRCCSNCEEFKSADVSRNSANLSSEVMQATFGLIPGTDLKIEATPASILISLAIKNSSESYRGMKGVMNQASSLLSAPSSSTLSTMLGPALTLAGLIPWILPGIQIATGFAQIINSMAFTTGLTDLIRSYVFDAKPDEHVVYVNHGYGSHGHTEHYQTGH